MRMIGILKKKTIFLSIISYVFGIKQIHRSLFLRQGDKKISWRKKKWRKKNAGFNYSGLAFFLHLPGVKKEYPEIY